MIQRFRKKPVVIEAVRYDGTNAAEIIAFAAPKAIINYNVTLHIVTLEGDMLVSIGDWVIKGIKGEFYPCKPDVFEKTYDEVTDQKGGEQ